MRIALRPDDEDVGDRRIGNPRLRARQDIAAIDLLRAGRHPAGVGARIGFGQPETADPFAAGQFGQIFALLLFRSIGVDRIHHEARLDAHHRPVAAVDPLDLPRDEAVADIAGTDPAIFLRNRRAEQPELTHLAEDRGIGVLVLKGVDDPRRQLVLRIGRGGVADHAFVFGQLIVEQKRVCPVELSHTGHMNLSCVERPARLLRRASQGHRPNRSVKRMSRPASGAKSLRKLACRRATTSKRLLALSNRLVLLSFPNGDSPIVALTIV